jgi:hypothetical protein
MRSKPRGGAHLGDFLHRWRVLDSWRDVRDHREGAPSAQARENRGAGRPDNGCDETKVRKPPQLWSIGRTIKEMRE